MLDKFVANVGEDRLDVPEGARPDLLPGPDPGLDRRARGGPRRGAAAHRRRLPEPARRHARASRTDPQRRPDGDLRHRHGGARQARRSTTGRTTRSGRRPRAPLADDRRCPRSSQGYQTYHDAGPASRARSPRRACLDRRRARARTPRTSYLYFLANPGRRRRRTPSPRRTKEHDANLREVRLPVTDDRRVARPGATSRRRPTPADRAALGRGRPRGPAGAARPAARAVRGRRRRRLLRRPPRAHALPDRASPSATARRRSPATPASSSSAATRSSSSPTRATRSRPGARRPRRGSSRPTTTCRRAGPSSSASVGARRVGGRGRRSSRTRSGSASRRPRRTSSSCRSRAGSRPTGRSRSRPSSSGSPPPAPSPTGRSPTLLPEIRPGVDRGRPRARASSG